MSSFRNTLLSLVALAASCGVAAQPAHAGKPVVVEADVDAGFVKGTLPFDEEFWIKGAAPASLQKVRMRFVRDGTADTVSCRPWRRLPESTAEEFHIKVPALEAGKRYWFVFDFALRLEEEDVSTIKTTLVRTMDGIARDLDLDAANVYTAVRARLKAALPPVDGRRITAPPRSVFGDSALSESDLEKRLGDVARLLTSEEQRRGSVLALEGEDGLIGRAARHLAHLGEDKGIENASQALDTKRGADFQNAALLASTLAGLTEEESGRIAGGAQALSYRDFEPPRPEADLETAGTPGELESPLSNLKTTYESLREMLSVMRRAQMAAAVPALDSATAAVGDVHFEMAALQSNLEGREALLAELTGFFDGILRYEAVVEGSSEGDFETRAGRYISVDFGLSHAPDLDRIFPYVGVNFYLVPVNKNVPLGEKGGFGRRFALMVGITTRSIEKEGEREGLIGDKALTYGAGIRIIDWLRFSVGGLLFYSVETNESGASKSLGTKFFYSISVDWDIKGTFQTLGSALAGG